MTARIRQLLRYLPLLFGGAGLVAFVAYGAVSGGLTPPELVPLTGIIISVVLILSNLWHRVPAPLRRRYSRALLILYTLGILFMGLRPKGTYEFAAPGTLALLDPAIPSAYVIAMNVVGFIPLGFLMVVAFTHAARLRSDLARFAAAVLVCGLVSLFIEGAQHLIVSRMSSLVDLVTNASGGLIGAGYGLLHVRLWRNGKLGEQTEAIEARPPEQAQGA